MGKSGKDLGGKAASPRHSDQIRSAFVCFSCLNLPVRLFLNKVLPGERKKRFGNYFSGENNPIVATDETDRRLNKIKGEPTIKQSLFQRQT